MLCPLEETSDPLLYDDVHGLWHQAISLEEALYSPARYESSFFTQNVPIGVSLPSRGSGRGMALASLGVWETSLSSPRSQIEPDTSVMCTIIPPCIAAHLNQFKDKWLLTSSTILQFCAHGKVCDLQYLFMLHLGCRYHSSSRAFGLLPATLYPSYSNTTICSCSYLYCLFCSPLLWSLPLTIGVVTNGFYWLMGSIVSTSALHKPILSNCGNWLCISTQNYFQYVRTIATCRALAPHVSFYLRVPASATDTWNLSWWCLSFRSDQVILRARS